jgi:hypothetical protein
VLIFDIEIKNKKIIKKKVNYNLYLDRFFYASHFISNGFVCWILFYFVKKKKNLISIKLTFARLLVDFNIIGRKTNMASIINRYNSMITSIRNCFNYERKNLFTILSFCVHHYFLKSIFLIYLMHWEKQQTLLILESDASALK